MFLLSFFFFFFWDHCNPQNAPTHVPRFFSLLPWQLNNAMFLTEKGHRQGNIALTHRQSTFQLPPKSKKADLSPGLNCPRAHLMLFSVCKWKMCLGRLRASQRCSAGEVHTYTHTHTCSSSSPDKSGTRTGNFGPKIMLRANFFPPPVPSCYPTLQLYATLPPKHARIGLLSQQTNRVILSSNHDIMTIWLQCET